MVALLAALLAGMPAMAASAETPGEGQPRFDLSREDDTLDFGLLDPKENVRAADAYALSTRSPQSGWTAFKTNATNNTCR